MYLLVKASFDEQKLLENLQVLMDAVVRAKPAAARGTYLRSIALSSTMGPGIKINPARF
jgi:large subunit ribosomal protein L1